MKLIVFGATLLSLFFIGCAQKEDDKKPSAKPAEDLSAFADEVGNDPFNIARLTSEADQLIEAGKGEDAQKKLRVIEAYLKAKPGYCTMKWAGKGTYIIGILPGEDREMTGADTNNDDVTYVGVTDEKWPTDDLAFMKILELKKAGICKNTGTCVRYEEMTGKRADEMLRIPIYGSNVRNFFDSGDRDIFPIDREEYIKMAQAVGLCEDVE